MAGAALASVGAGVGEAAGAAVGAAGAALRNGMGIENPLGLVAGAASSAQTAVQPTGAARQHTTLNVGTIRRNRITASQIMARISNGRNPNGFHHSAAKKAEATQTLSQGETPKLCPQS
jgi:hypothetical protein